MAFSCDTRSADRTPDAVPAARVPEQRSADRSQGLDQASAEETGPLLLTPDGWGPLRIGMTRRDVVALMGEDANPGAAGGPDPAQCDELRPLKAPAGVLIMIEHDRLTRISVSRNTEIATPAGIHVGDSGATVAGAYGDQAVVTDHQFWPSPARYVTVWRPAPGQARRGVRYEINADDDVAVIRAGEGSIEYVEGCS